MKDYVTRFLKLANENEQVADAVAMVAAAALFVVLAAVYSLFN